MPNPAKANKYTDTATSTKQNQTRLVNFIQTAWSHIDEDGSWTWSYSGVASKPRPWCAAFVVACARYTGGILGHVIYSTGSCHDMLKLGVENDYGKMVNGPKLGNYNMPQQGDLIFYRWSKSGYRDDYAADHVGIVCYVYQNYFVTVEGNYGGENDLENRVAVIQRNPNNTDIYCYFRPSWGLLGLQTTETGEPLNSQTLNGYIVGMQSDNLLFGYTNDTDDAELREVYYADNNGGLQTKKSDYRISIINYTSVLSSVYNALMMTGMQQQSGTEVVADDMPSIGTSKTTTTSYASYAGEDAEKIIWKTLYTNIQNAYGVAGIMGNMKAESGLVPYRLQGDFSSNYKESLDYTEKVDTGEISRYAFAHKGPNGGGYGLVQWTWYSYKEDLYDYAEKNGKSVGDLTVQLQFLISVISSGEFKGLWSTLRNAKNVTDASNAFLHDFENPLHQDESVERTRAEFGQQYYNKYYSLTLRGMPR